MRRTRFTEQQIVGGRIKLNPGYRLRFVREAPDFGSDVIQLDGEIRWAERLGPEALEEARRREREAEEDVRGSCH